MAFPILTIQLFDLQYMPDQIVRWSRVEIVRPRLGKCFSFDLAVTVLYFHLISLLADAANACFLLAPHDRRRLKPLSCLRSGRLRS